MKNIVFILILTAVLGACATVSSTADTSSYEETISKWTSYNDVEKWMSENFAYDWSRLMSRLNSPSLFTRPARVTFKIKSGVCSDGARFIQETLNTINPTYEARIVYFESPFRLQRGHNVTHAVCSFKVDGKLYYMDYATPNGHTMGTFGPFDSLKDIEAFYASHTGGGIVGYYVTIKNDQLIRDDGPRFLYKGKLLYKGE